MTAAYRRDCMEAMREMPDQAFDLAVVDPPYGDGGAAFRRRDGARFGGRFDRYRLEGGIRWDAAPGEDYFRELFRVSKNQIIWGGNYFSLPPCRCFLVWRKLTISESFSMAMCEYAWTSFPDNAKFFECPPQGEGERIHPTQKPVKLYAWLLGRYAKAGDRILDTHLGSGSSRIAAHDLGLDFVGYEIDEGYFERQERRFAAHAAQTSLFLRGEQIPSIEEAEHNVAE